MTLPAVRGGLAISGLYDLEPIRLNYLNEKLGLDEAEAERNSPLLHIPPMAGELVIAYGTREFQALGISFDRRAQRTREYIDVMRKLWTQGSSSHQGEFARPDPLSGGNILRHRRGGYSDGNNSGKRNHRRNRGPRMGMTTHHGRSTKMPAARRNASGIINSPCQSPSFFSLASASTAT